MSAPDQSCSTSDYQSGNDAAPAASSHGEDAAGVPPSRTLTAAVPSSFSSSRRSLPIADHLFGGHHGHGTTHHQFSRHTFNAGVLGGALHNGNGTGNGLHRHMSAAAAHHNGHEPFFARAASLTDIPCADDDSLRPPALAFGDHDDQYVVHDDPSMRSMPMPTTTLHTGNFDERPVFRSVAAASDDYLMAPPGLSTHSNVDKLNAMGYTAAAHNSDGFGRFGIGMMPSLKAPMTSSLLSSPSEDLSLKPPSLGGGGSGLLGQPQLVAREPTIHSNGHARGGAAQYTTFATLSTMCTQTPRVITLAPYPMYVEPHTHFELVAAPAQLALRIGGFLEERRAVFHFVAADCRFEAHAATTDGIQFAFHVNVFDGEREPLAAANDDELACCVEFQRRQGDCIAFQALYRDAKARLSVAPPQQQEASSGDFDDTDLDAVCAKHGVPREDVEMSCAVLMCDNIDDDNELHPNKTLTKVEGSTLATLNEMINSKYFEEQFQATTAVAHLTMSEANCRAILDDADSVHSLVASLHEKRDERVQHSAAKSVANLVAHPEHVPRGSLNVIVVALIALLLISTSLEVVRETARALVSLADLKQDFDAQISGSVRSVLEKLAATRDEVAEGYRVELARKVGIITPSY